VANFYKKSVEGFLTQRGHGLTRIQRIDADKIESVRKRNFSFWIRGYPFDLRESVSFFAFNLRDL